MRLALGDAVFDSDARELVRGGLRVPLSTRALSLLELLAAARPRALSKEELQAALWPDVVVSEGSLMSLVSELRQALEDSRKGAAFIRTVHGFGYAFSAQVAELSPDRPTFSRLRLELDGRDLPLRQGENVIGRDEAAGVRVDRATVSRRHARILVSGNEAVLEDLDSKNGTWLDGVKVGGAVKLRDGAVLKIGAVALVFKGAGTLSTQTLHEA